jgi:hypothetical protein
MEVEGLGGPGRPDGRTHCASSTSVRFLGQNRPFPSYCYAHAYGSGLNRELVPKPGDAGPDDQRTLHCEVKLVTEAATALEAAAAGERIEIYARVPGVALVPGELPPKGKFTPAHGKKTSRTSTIVLKKPKSTAARNRAALERYCRRHKKLGKTRYCPRT